MSRKNRKLTYDKLVKAERFEHISERLKAEFGDPESTPTDTNFSGMSKDQLKAEADKAGLEYTTRSTKDDLIVLLETKEDKEAESEEEETQEEDEPETEETE